MVRPRRTLVGILSLLIAGTAFAEGAQGYLQVKVPAGTIVNVDRLGAKKTVDPEGVTFREVAPGTYWVTLERPGFERQRISIDVEIGAVAVVNPKPWQPVPAGAAEKKPAKGYGALIVQTFPVDATIDAKRLGWNKITKSDEPFIASNVPAGTHKVTFCNEYKCLDYRAQIRPGRLLSIIVDFDPGEIEDVSRLHRTQLASWRSGCAGGDATSCRRACNLDASLSPNLPSVACAAIERDVMIAGDDRKSDYVPVSRNLTPP